MKKNKIHNEKKQQLAEIQAKFNEWRLNIYACVFVYLGIFFSAKAIINKWVKPNIKDCLISSKVLTILGVGFFLGWLFVADNIISSYLKTPLQRLGIKIENYPFDPDRDKSEKIKKWLLTKTQETNEMFKETFKKFGILAIPAILVNLIDNGEVYCYKMEDVILGRPKPGATPIAIVIKEGERNSENIFFYICYAIPIIYATFSIITLGRELKKLDRKLEKSKN